MDIKVSSLSGDGDLVNVLRGVGRTAAFLAEETGKQLGKSRQNERRELLIGNGRQKEREGGRFSRSRIIGDKQRSRSQLLQVFGHREAIIQSCPLQSVDDHRCVRSDLGERTMVKI